MKGLSLIKASVLYYLINSGVLNFLNVCFLRYDDFVWFITQKKHYNLGAKWTEIVFLSLKDSYSWKYES